MHSRSAPAPLPSWPHPCLAAPRPLSAEERPKKGCKIALSAVNARVPWIRCGGGQPRGASLRCAAPLDRVRARVPSGRHMHRRTTAAACHSVDTHAPAVGTCSKRWVGDDCKMNLVRRSGLHWLCAGSRPPAREPHLVLISRECEWIGEWPR